MTGNEFLALAEMLHGSSLGTSEAIRRTVISRSYYGAFHLARSLLEELGERVGKDHGDVWNRFGLSGVVVAKQIATKLAILHENRIVADYQLDSPKPNDIAFVADNVERAKDIQALLMTCSQEPMRSQIQTGIQLRRRK